MDGAQAADRRTAPARQRRFLFLQGPHGPFFRDLATALRRTGAGTARVMFNRGDRLFWRQRPGDMVYRGPLEDWPETLLALVEARGITDIVIYGDAKPAHLPAAAVARALGLRLHVFEEGYLRPWWITYERGGSNGHSALCAIPTEEMAAALARPAPAPPPPAEGWGALRRHMALGALYHAAILSGGPALPPHRNIALSREVWLNVRQLCLLPLTALRRRAVSRALLRRAVPFHLVLLQLDHDASFRSHGGGFGSTAAFLSHVIDTFAAHAPRHHRLVLKAHPLEDGRVGLPGMIKRLAKAAGVSDRVDYIPGGKLAPLLDRAKSAITVNSTSAQQALWRGLPVRSFGRSVYDRDGFVSRQPLSAFFRAPDPPDRRAYLSYRQFLLETSQRPGSFYTAKGRRQLCRDLPDMMLATDDPYTARLAAERQHSTNHFAPADRKDWQDRNLPV